MSQRRTLILVAAIAIGALASFLVWNYVNGVQDDAYKNAERVPVFLIKQQVSRGMTGAEAQAYIVKENIPRKFKPSNAIVSLEDIAGKVALSNLVPNQVVVSDMFVDVSDPRAQQSFTERLTKIRREDQTTITIQVDSIRGVAGLIQPGDYINMLYLQEAASTNGSATTGGATPLGTGGARMLYQKVLVLAVDKSAVPQPGDSQSTDGSGTGATAATPAVSNSGMLTLIVPTAASQRIATAAAGGKLYLTLVAKDYTPKAVDPIDPTSPAPGEDPTQLTPYGPKGDDSSN